MVKKSEAREIGSGARIYPEGKVTEKSKQKRPDLYKTVEPKVSEFVRNLAQSPVNFKAVDMERLTLLWARVHGRPVNNLMLLRQRIQAEKYSEANATKRASRIVQGEEPPDYIKSVTGMMSKIVSNPVTNGIWQDKPKKVKLADGKTITISRKAARAGGLKPLFGFLNLWIESQLAQKDASRIIRKVGISNYLNGRYGFSGSDEGSD